MELRRTRQEPQTCRWSVPTLLMPRPYWLSAEKALWCCWNDRQIVVLTSTDVCHTCPMWKSRGKAAERIDAIPAQGAMPFREP